MQLRGSWQEIKTTETGGARSYAGTLTNYQHNHLGVAGVTPDKTSRQYGSWFQDERINAGTGGTLMVQDGSVKAHGQVMFPCLASNFRGFPGRGPRTFEN